jgi:hypothetical protein
MCDGPRRNGNHPISRRQDILVNTGWSLVAISGGRRNRDQLQMFAPNAIRNDVRGICYDEFARAEIYIYGRQLSEFGAKSRYIVTSSTAGEPPYGEAALRQAGVKGSRDLTRRA